MSKFEVEFVNVYVDCLCFLDHICPRSCTVIDIVGHRVADIVDHE